MNNLERSGHQDGIAIIGMSGCFPGAKDIDEFWKNLKNGIESISFFSDQDLKASGMDASILNNANYVKAGAVLEDIDLFDASFFGLNPREAETMDPQHRLFLEHAWKALEKAGYDADRYDGTIGVYAGEFTNTYLLSNLYSNPDLINNDFTNFMSDSVIRLGNEKDYLATLVSYKLNLKGPSISVQTACSTSLVAVHLGCQSLLNGECDMALAGGVSIRIPQKAGYFYQEEGILSPDGHSRTFDAEARGTLFGNGLGVIVLKRLADALDNGDNIHAVIKGSAINNDGSLKVGYSAPSINGQAQVIAESLAVADIAPQTISYIEAHGTATAMGDPIEIEALTQVFRASTEVKGFCAIGSVKTNVGHLSVASGITGLIKTVLMLKHRLIPASLHFEEPNPKIDFKSSPFYVNTTLSKWDTNDQPLRAGVNSFGMGGTNAHVVIEEAPHLEVSGKSRPCHLLVLSAKTDSALEIATTRFVEYLKHHPDVNLADVAYTYSVGRRTFNNRRMVVFSDCDDAISALETPEAQRVFTTFQEPKDQGIVFMFPGQGAQYANMALELYQVEPTFREQVDICSELLKTHLKFDLRDFLYPIEERTEESMQYLKQTVFTQPAIFVIEYALAQLWMSWGVQPQALIGHSTGEYVAACLAGVFSLEDALELVAVRGKMIQKLPGGSMLAVPLPEKEIQNLLGKQLSIAAVNEPSLCVVSGPTDAVEKLEQQLTQRGLASRRVNTSHAFHSEMMAPIVEPFTEQVSKIRMNPPRIPYVSSVTGTWITKAEATDPRYWARHLRHTIRFAEGIEELAKEPEQILLEVGPGSTLSSFARRHPKKPAGQVVLSSLHHSHDQSSDVPYLMNTLGRLWLSGIPVNWSKFYAHERRCRLPLPTYPFEQERYWIESSKKASSADTHDLEKKSSITDWFYIPTWKQSIPPVTLESENGNDKQKQSKWLVFIDSCGLGSQIVQRLKKEGQDVTTVTVANQFATCDNATYTINPRQQDNYDALIEKLSNLDKIPERIVHLWGITPNDDIRLGIEFFDKSQDLGLYSLLFLVQALEKRNVTASLKIEVVSQNMQNLGNGEVFCPEKITVLAPCKVIPQEYPNIACRSIDVTVPKLGTRQEQNLINQLLAEIKSSEPSDLAVAYRGDYRFVQTVEPIPLNHEREPITRLRQRGAYLITGGLGHIGQMLSEYLAENFYAKLILIERSELPPRKEWEHWLAAHEDPSNTVTQKIEHIQKLEQLGAEVLVVNADVANLAQMEKAINAACTRFGQIHGVIHAAGFPGDKWDRTIRDTSYEECSWHFQPKVQGLYVLETILRERKLDFCILISSLSSVLGGLRLVSYTASNLFMDAFAQHQSQTNKHTSWISVNWDVWLHHQQEKTQNTGLGKSMDDKAIKPQEGIEVFQYALSIKAIPQIIVSTWNLQARIDQWIKFKPLQDEESKKVNTSSFHSRPDLKNPHVAPSSNIEQKIANIWRDILGIEQIGVNDDFFELGGNSLISVQLTSKLRESFDVELPLAQFLEAPTVEKLATIIGDSQFQTADGEDITRILEEIEALSPDEIQVLLESEKENQDG